MRISTKLIAFFIGVVALFCGLATASFRQIRAVCGDYDALIEGPVRQADQARIVQVDFKKQVQEWKDILLRGHDAGDLAKYTRQFRDKQAKVRAEAASLAQEIGDEEAGRALNAFLVAHDELGGKYEKALDVYLRGFDFKAADKVVRGQDRAPTDLFDQVVARLDARVQLAIGEQKLAVARERAAALTVTGVLLAMLGAAGFIIVHGIVARLRRLKSVSDRLARADVQGLAIDISGSDEVGEFGESMKGVHAAIEELSTLAARSSVAS